MSADVRNVASREIMEAIKRAKLQGADYPEIMLAMLCTAIGSHKMNGGELSQMLAAVKDCWVQVDLMEIDKTVEFGNDGRPN